MARWLLAFVGTLTLIGLSSTAARADDGKLILQVVRLKPGAARQVELALTDAPLFRPAGKPGRDMLRVDVLPGAPKKASLIAPESKDNTFTGRPRGPARSSISRSSTTASASACTRAASASLSKSKSDRRHCSKGRIS